MKALYKQICVFIFFPVFLISGYSCIAQEICNNGKDDDGDGLIDLYDPDCQCRFTVTDNLLLNGSFESYNHCPVYYTYDKDSAIADYWRFGTYTNIGEAIYYHNFKCTFDSNYVVSKMPPVRPLPQGEGFISIQNNSSVDPVPENTLAKTYVGQCLQAPLKNGVSYTISFYAGRFRSWDNLTGKIFPFTVAVFGNANCNAVPFGKVYASGNGCPANYTGWVLLGKTTMYSSGQWVQGKVNLTIPFDINVIEVGPDCSILPSINDLTDSTTFLDYHEYYLDDLHLLPTKDFPFQYIQTQAGVACNGLPLLQAPVYTKATYQWYKDSIAIIGATNSTYQVLDTKGISYYNALITTTGKCITTEPFLITASKLDEIKIPADTAICINDAVLLAPAIAGITYSVNGITTSSVIINKEGLYNIIAADEYGCTRTFVTHVIQQNCTDCDAFIPNAFSPNGDGLNDLFKPVFNCLITRFHFIIFDRWGEKVFESSDVNKEWNGIYSGKKLPAGSYVYYMEYKTSSGNTRKMKGVVTIIM